MRVALYTGPSENLLGNVMAMLQLSYNLYEPPAGRSACLCRGIISLRTSALAFPNLLGIGEPFLSGNLSLCYCY